MRPEEVMKFVAITVVVLLPTFVITVAIAARFALKPIAESILHFRKAFSEHDTALLGSADVERLERKVADLEREIEVIKSEREFDRVLIQGAKKQLEEPK